MKNNFKLGDKVEIIGVHNMQNIKFKIGMKGIIIDKLTYSNAYRVEVKGLPNISNWFSSKELKLIEKSKEN